MQTGFAPAPFESLRMWGVLVALVVIVVVRTAILSYRLHGKTAYVEEFTAALKLPASLRYGSRVVHELVLVSR